jgi:hypothetical protein
MIAAPFVRIDEEELRMVPWAFAADSQVPLQTLIHDASSN